MICAVVHKNMDKGWMDVKKVKKKKNLVCKAAKFRTADVATANLRQFCSS